MSFDDPDAVGRLAYLSLLLVMIIFFSVRMRRRDLPRLIRDGAVWILIFAMVVIAYGFRDVLRRELFPSNAITEGDGALVLRRAEDGHFYAYATINNKRVKFLIDTGASEIVLAQQDAERVGFPPDRLDFSEVSYTANGTVETARITLDTVEFGQMIVNDHPASVSGGEMLESLMGMAFLDRFDRIEIFGDTMRLHP